MSETDHLFVITGGPSSGKSTLVAHLAASGLHHMPEGGRAIIQDQVAIGGDALPWVDRESFAQLMLGWELRSHHEARRLPGPVILDRGLPDVIAYLILCDLPVPASLQRAAELYRYNRRVFIAPYWPEIFTQDAERKQVPEEAEAQFHVLRRVYVAHGYELVVLPVADVAERARFVRTQLA